MPNMKSFFGRLNRSERKHKESNRSRKQKNLKTVARQKPLQTADIIIVPKLDKRQEINAVVRTTLPRKDTDEIFTKMFVEYQQNKCRNNQDTCRVALIHQFCGSDGGKTNFECYDKCYESEETQSMSSTDESTCSFSSSDIAFQSERSTTSSRCSTEKGLFLSSSLGNMDHTISYLFDQIEGCCTSEFEY